MGQVATEGTLDGEECFRQVCAWVRRSFAFGVTSPTGSQDTFGNAVRHWMHTATPLTAIAGDVESQRAQG